MVSQKSVEKQLKHLKFNQFGWGRAEVKELPHILLEGETIYEVTNGIYDGGFALLVATNIRVLLIDKKPLNYLTVEDLRFDMINEIDYNHRLLGAKISISAGSKNLSFHSYNQPRLRKLINHVQHCMAETKKKQSENQEDQQEHLAQINKQLQSYLFATHQQQQALQEQLKQAQSQGVKLPDDYEPVKPSPELADYLFSQSLLAKHGLEAEAQPADPKPAAPAPTLVTERHVMPSNEMKELYSQGMQEIYGRQPQPPTAATVTAPAPSAPASQQITPIQFSQDKDDTLEINPLKIAYSKLPMALRNRRFGRPSFHAHSQSQAASTAQATAQSLETAI